MPRRLRRYRARMAAGALNSELVELALELIRRRSVTPDDAGCQDLLAARLTAAGFDVERQRHGEVENLIAGHGQGRPHLMLLGHTDVVPAGPETAWTVPPFRPEFRDGFLWGRGAADMKSSVAAFVLAMEQFLRDRPQHGGRLSLLLTSDEEGAAADGVRRVVPELERCGRLPDHVLVGEPSSNERLGDVIRIGRRGSIQARLVVRGVQGHTAYARPDENPVHRGAALVVALAGLQFDDGDAAFPATTLQISNLRAGTGADNVTPGELEVLFNLRHNPNATAEALERRVRALIDEVGPADAELHWRISGAPFGPATGLLRAAVEQAVVEQLGQQPRADTGGGTSDGRFFGPLGIETVELGPVNRTIHRIDERIAVGDLEQLPGLYLNVIERLLGSSVPASPPQP